MSSSSGTSLAGGDVGDVANGDGTATAPALRRWLDELELKPDKSAEFLRLLQDYGATAPMDLIALAGDDDNRSLWTEILQGLPPLKRSRFKSMCRNPATTGSDFDGLTAAVGGLSIEDQIEAVQDRIVNIFERRENVSICVGASGFMEVVKSGFYVDKTKYALVLLEHCRAVLLRPPRMGKTLFLSVLLALFDTAYKKVFPKLFNGLYVATAATPDQRAQFNSFHVLRFCLPGAAGGSFAKTMASCMRKALVDFFERHPDLAHIAHQRIRSGFVDRNEPWEVVRLLASVPDVRLLVLVDEIDRAVMGDGAASMDDDSSSTSSHGAGRSGRGSGSRPGDESTPFTCVKQFLHELKDLGGVGVRYYITGIFPVTTGSSIFNGKDDLTHSEEMAEAFGLTAADVEQALRTHVPDVAVAETVHQIRRDANGLHPFNSTVALFNPQLVQVALRQLLDNGKLASTVMDENQLLTRNQLARVLRSTKTAVKVLSGASFHGEVSKTVSPEETMDPATLLFYLGVVSPGQPVQVDSDDVLAAELRIPNRATRKQFVHEFIKRTRGKLGSADRFLRNPMRETLRTFLAAATSMRWTSRQTEDDLKALFFAEILHFTDYVPAAEHSYGGGRTDISAQVHNTDGTTTLVIVELKTLRASRSTQSLLKSTSDGYGFEWDTKRDIEYSKDARAQMDKAAPEEGDLLPLKVTYSNSGKAYKTVQAVHESAIEQAARYKQRALGLVNSDGSRKFEQVVAFAVTQVVHRFVVSCEVGGSGGAGGGGGGAGGGGGGDGGGKKTTKRNAKKKKTKKKKK